MRGFFSAEGTFFSVCSKIVDMIVITFLWLIGCIPIVTILASTASMYHTTVKCVRYDRGKASRDFIEAYKKNVKQGVGLTVLYGVIGVVIAVVDYKMVFLTQSRTSTMFMFSLGMFIVTCLYLINLLWIVPVFSRFSNTFGNIVRLNFVISFRHLIRSVFMLFIIVAGLILVLASAPLIILMPSLILLCVSYLSEPGLRKFMPKQEEDNGDWRYGFK